MLQVLIEPLQSSFMQRALVIAVLVGIVCAIVGSYLMVQRLALLGDAISHSVLPGLAIAFMIGADIFVGAFIAGVLSTVVITFIRTRSPIKEDAAMGIVFSAFFALGITLITIIQKDNKIEIIGNHQYSNIEIKESNIPFRREIDSKTSTIISIQINEDIVKSKN